MPPYPTPLLSQIQGDAALCRDLKCYPPTVLVQDVVHVSSRRTTPRRPAPHARLMLTMQYAAIVQLRVETRGELLIKEQLTPRAPSRGISRN